jgi:hypothetical protein
MAPHTIEHPYLLLNGNSGYSRHGDTVSLFADRIDNLNNAGITSGNLALQLWGCQAAYTGGNLTGWKLAEFQPGILQADHFLAPVKSNVPASFPESGDYAIVLVIAEWDGEGFNLIHDFHNYPNRDVFLNPCLDGLMGYRCVDDGRLVVDVGCIHNPRDPNNLSGTLSLELWALPEPYFAGDFEGHALGGVTLGSLAGGANWHDCAYDLEITPPPAGTYTLVLMLREWVGNGYVTRDHTNFRDQVTFPIATTSPRASETEISAAPRAQVANTVQSPEQAGEASVARHIGGPGQEHGTPPPKDSELVRATQQSRHHPARDIFDTLKRFAQRLMDRLKQRLTLER